MFAKIKKKYKMSNKLNKTKQNVKFYINILNK